MRIEIPSKKKKYPGIFAYCCACNKHLNTNNINRCKHFDKQKYRFITRDPNSGKQVSRILTNRNYIDAIREADEIKKLLAQGNIHLESQDEEKPLNLVKAVGLYLDFLWDINVPGHKKKYRGKNYISQQASLLQDFILFLDGEKINLEYFKITEVKDKLVGKYYDYLEEKYKNPSTFNHHIKTMRTFYNKLEEELGYNLTMKNPFNGIREKDHFPKMEMIEKEDLDELLLAIRPENGIQILQSLAVKRHYFPWIKDAILLGLYTGRREEELINMKFSDINVDPDGIPETLTYFDLKQERQKGKKLNKNEMMEVTLPIFTQFRDLLYELGFEEFKGTDRFLIAPDLDQRKVLAQRMSKSFSHFWNHTGITKHITFKSLRKVNLTAHKQYQMENRNVHVDQIVRIISNHKSDSVLRDHYLYKKAIAKIIAKSDFRIF